MANYVTGINQFNFNVRFDGTTLAGSLDLKQSCLTAGFVTNPLIILDFAASDNHGNPIPGATASLTGTVLNYTLPGGTTAFNSFYVSLGF